MKRNSIISMTAAVLIFLCAGGRPGRAQAPVIPDSPEIAGYVHFTDLKGFAGGMDKVAQGVFPPEYASRSIGSIFGDPNLGNPTQSVVRNGQPAAWLWIRNAGAQTDPKFLSLIVLPVTSDPGYLAICAQRLQMQIKTQTGEYNLLGSTRALELAQNLLPSIKALYGAKHPPLMSAYFSKPFIASRIESAKADLAAMISGKTASGLRPPASASLQPVQFWLAGLGRLVEQLDMLNGVVRPSDDALSVILNVSALPGTPLETFCKEVERKDPKTTFNPMAGFLPANGVFRGCVDLGDKGFPVLMKKLATQAASDVKMAPTEQTQMMKSLDAILLFKGRCALQMTDLKSFTAIVTPVDPDTILEKIRLLIQGDRNLNGLLKTAGMKNNPAAPTPAQAGASPPSLGGSSPSAATSSSLVTLEKGDPRENVESFSIDRFLIKGTEGGMGAASLSDQMLLTSSLVGDYLVVSPQMDETKAAMNRILLLKPTTPPLESQKIFLEGGFLYGDGWLPGATPDIPAIHVMARSSGPRLQMSIHLPVRQISRLVPSAPTPAR